MSKKAIINIVCCVVAVAIVATSTFFVARHFKNSNDNVVILNPVTNNSSSGGGDYSASGSISDETTTAEETTVEETNTKKKTNNTSGTGSSSANTGTVSSNTGSGSNYTGGNGSSGGGNSNAGGNSSGNSTPATDPAGLNQNSKPTNENAKKEAGTLGFMWNSKDEVFYSASDPWQRAWGYNYLYDWAAKFIVLYFDTVRVKFNYGGYDWMIQLWKGQYGFVLLGAEVGVYYKTEGSSVEHYRCDDNSMRLKVGYDCYDHDKILFSRTYQDTWWLTGFVPGKLDRFSDRSEMMMNIRFTLKDKNMTKAFIDGLKSAGFSAAGSKFASADTYYNASGSNDVFVSWRYIAQKGSA